jgi:BirA family biotin operon repressor/biotin-[acetyl-CoA-carboxylase] ligase
MNKPAFYRQNGEVFEGIITGVSDLGLLQIDREGTKHEFNFKEIEFLNHTSNRTTL